MNYKDTAHIKYKKLVVLGDVIHVKQLSKYGYTPEIAHNKMGVVVYIESNALIVRVQGSRLDVPPKHYRVDFDLYRWELT